MMSRRYAFAWGLGAILLFGAFKGGEFFSRHTLDKTASGVKFIQNILIRRPGIILDSQPIQNAVTAEYQRRAVAAQVKVRRDTLKVFYADAAALSTAPFLGNKSGGLSMIEVTDYNCAPCRASAGAVRQILTVAPDLKIYLVFLPIYGVGSELAARAAIAIFRQSPASFSKFHDLMMTSKAPLSQSYIISLVAGLGLDTNRFQALLNDQETIETLDRMQKLTTRLKLSGVPSFLMGDEFLDGGASVGKLQSMIVSYTESPSHF